ncbi:hypothetical protein DFH06DRAFT_579661 [Mycena polygramma]|nr:hypothetical protein DFH06DRAFT_579661 [Mycena polygramma]
MHSKFLILLSISLHAISLCGTHALSIPARSNLNPEVPKVVSTKNVCAALRQSSKAQGWQTINLRGSIGPPDCVVQGTPANPRPPNVGKGTYYTYKPGDTTTTATGVNDARDKTLNTVPTSTEATCDHMLELNLLARVMESTGGPCDQLAKLYLANNKDTAIAKTNALIALAKDKTNLAFVANELELQKGLVVQHTFNPAPDYTDLLIDVKKRISNDDIANRLKAVDKLVSATSTQALNLAARMDAEIQRSFPGTKLTVVGLWNEVVATAHTLALHPPPQFVPCPKSRPNSPTAPCLAST